MIDKLQKILKKHLHDLIALAIISVFVLLSSKAMFHTGFFRTIDDITTVRVEHLARELKRGEWVNNFPVRWAADLSHGYGYPIYTFYAPLSYYVGSTLMIIANLSDIVATKAIYAFPLLIGSYLFYWASRRRLEWLSAISATIVYTVFPFRGFDTYIRGGVGEAWAMAFLPALVGGLFLIQDGNKFGKYIVAIFLALSILSHNISALLILSFVLIYGVIFLFKKKDFWLSVVLGLGLSTFFWMPMIAYLNIVKITYSESIGDKLLVFLEPVQKLVNFNFTYVPMKTHTPLIFYIFLTSLVVFILKRKILHNEKRVSFLFWLSISLIMYSLLSEVSKPFWQFTLPVSRLLQFPWRLLILMSVTIPMSIGYATQSLQQKISKYTYALMISASMLIFLPFFAPKEYSYFYSYSAEDSGPCATSVGEEYLPIWTKKCITSGNNSDIFFFGGDFEETYNSKIVIEGVVDTEADTEFEVNNYYFPGWTVYVDGKKVPVEYTYSKHGLFKAKVTQGRHNLTVKYTKTNVMWVADIITLLTLMLIVCGAGAIAINRKKDGKPKK